MTFAVDRVYRTSDLSTWSCTALPQCRREHGYTCGGQVPEAKDSCHCFLPEISPGVSLMPRSRHIVCGACTLLAVPPSDPPLPPAPRQLGGAVRSAPGPPPPLSPPSAPPPSPPCQLGGAVRSAPVPPPLSPPSASPPPPLRPPVSWGALFDPPQSWPPAPRPSGV